MAKSFLQALGSTPLFYIETMVLDTILSLALEALSFLALGSRSRSHFSSLALDLGSISDFLALDLALDLKL